MHSECPTDHRQENMQNAIQNEMLPRDDLVDSVHLPKFFIFF